MGWPKHKYGWIVLGGWSEPVHDNGLGRFVESGRNGFAEVFLDRRAAEWVKRDQRASYARLAKYAPEFPKGNEGSKRDWLRHYANVRIIRIALPGTYPQFQVPGRLERNLSAERRRMKPTA
jgi:hypothetical protein